MSILDYTTSSLETGLDLTTTTSTGGCGTCGGSELVGLERTRFFARQLIGPDDLTQDQTYFREKSRRHNRLLHGWGIACGACVAAGTGACEVVVEPGYVLGPYGDEIVIDSEVTVDVCKQDPTGAAFDPCGGVDPWCSDVRTQRRPDQVMYLAVRYTECDTRPVRVTGCGCGCDDAECEYSRTRDSYELKVLTELPDSYKRFDKLTQLQEILLLLRSFACIGRPRACPPCPTSPWVILADLQLDAAGKVTVECAPHRRYVASFGQYFFRCGTESTSVLGVLPFQSKASMLIDSQLLEGTPEEAPQPAATVAARRADGQWLTVPATFSVEKGETIRQVLAREGDRTLVDLATGDTMTLREVYAAAGADPNTKVDTVTEALAPLEGAKIDVAGLRVVRGAYDELIDKHGLDRLDETHGGSPAAATELPAQTLQGVEDASAVGKHVAGKTVAEVAATPKKTFVAEATHGLKGTQRAAETARAEEVWTAAARVVKLSSAWGG